MCVYIFGRGVPFFRTTWAGRPHANWPGVVSGPIFLRFSRARRPIPTGRGPRSAAPCNSNQPLKKDSEVVVWLSICWRLGVPRSKNHTCSRNEWLFGLATFGSQANKNHSFLKMCGFWASVPPASKKHLAKQQLMDPFEQLKSAMKSNADASP